MFDIEKILSRRLLFVSGKGGVGKSFISANLALNAAKQGKKVLLVESSSKEQLAPLFFKDPVGHCETLISHNLFCINLKPSECFREYVVDHLGLEKLYERLLSRKLMKSFLDAIPGLNESMLLGRLFHSSQLLDLTEEYDLVVFDAPASGHFLNLLTTPDAVLQAGLVGPLIREIKRIRQFIADEKKCGTLIVGIPEELVTSEILEFIPKLESESPSKLLGVLINRCYPFSKEFSKLEQIKELNKEFSPVVDFILNKGKQKIIEQEKVSAGLSELGLDGKYTLLPDLGVINEPLNSIVADKLWGSNFEI